MKIETDSSDNRFVEVEMDNGEKVRITHVAKSWSGQSGLRIQIREESGHLRMGPEIPVGQIGDVVAACINFAKS